MSVRKMSRAKRAWHRLEHAFGWNTGRSVTWWNGPFLVTAFCCSGCGALAHAALGPVTRASAVLVRQ